MPLNVAMYAFTDRVIAQVLIEEGDAGTMMRVYRDGEQYEEEAAATESGPWHRCFEGIANIQVRVKPLSRSDLMHLKCWSDGRILRDGSANWSPAGLKRQDNEIRYTTDRQEVQEFNQNFEQIMEQTRQISRAVTRLPAGNRVHERAKNGVWFCVFSSCTASCCRRD